MNKLAKMVIKDRKNSALNQKEYGDLINVSVTTIVGLEKGAKVGSKVIKALAFHFNKNTKEIRKLMLTEVKGD